MIKKLHNNIIAEQTQFTEYYASIQHDIQTNELQKYYASIQHDIQTNEL